jgi:hypothetical protein
MSLVWPWYSPFLGFGLSDNPDDNFIRPGLALSSKRLVRGIPLAQSDHQPCRDVASIIYNHRPGTHAASAFGETAMPQVSQPAKETKIMGDRSPKSNKKKSTQKQAQANSAEQKKKQAVAAKSAAGKNR